MISALLRAFPVRAPVCGEHREFIQQTEEMSYQLDEACTMLQLQGKACRT